MNNQKDNLVQENLSIPRQVITDSFSEYLILFTQLFLQEQYARALELSVLWLEKEHLNESQLTNLITNLEQLGAINKVLFACQKLIDLKPSDTGIIIKYANLLKLSGNGHDAIQVVRKHISDNPKLLPLYEYVLVEAIDRQDNDAAKEVIELAELNGFLELKDRYLESMHLESNSLDSLRNSQENLDAEISSIQISRFMSLFEGRENCYARQWISDDGKSGYSPVYEPLTPALVQNHLSGNITLGIYQLDLKNMVKWIAFDIDIDKSMLDELHSASYQHWIQGGYDKILNQVKERLEVHHIKANFEFSGMKGYHVWLFLDEKVNARLARDFARCLVLDLDFEGYPLHVEVFPKQSIIKTEQLGNLVKLPMGIHRVSGLKSCFLDHNSEDLRLTQFLDTVEITPQQSIISALKTMNPDLADKMTNESVNDYCNPAKISYPVSEPKQKAHFILEEDNDWLWLKSHCSVIDNIDLVIQQTHQLDAEQKNVLIHTCGHLENGVDIVNSLLRRCIDYDAADDLKSRLRGNVISCQKIRKTISRSTDIDVCKCDFSSTNCSYPHPLIHMAARAEYSTPNPDFSDLVIKHTIQKYLELKKQSYEIHEAFTTVENELIALFDTLELEQFSTSLGILTRSGEPGNYSLSLTLK